VDANDIDLLRAYCRDGDHAAFARLVGRHGDWIRAAARRRLGDDHLADDATQAVFVVLLDKAQRLLESDRASLSPWLFHVVHFTCARLRRSHAREKDLRRWAEPEPSPGADQVLGEGGQLLLLMEDCIAELPPLDRDVVVRRFYRHQSFPVIGRATGTSAEAARKRLGRAVATIKSLMVSKGGDAIPDELLAVPRRGARSTRSATVSAAQTDAIHLAHQGEAAMTQQQQQPSAGGYTLISVEFLVRDVETNLEFFEKLGFPRRWLDKPDPDGRLPRASLTAGAMGKIWVRRAADGEIHPSSSINPFFWVDGGPDALVAHRKKIADQGVAVTPIIDEHALPNFSVTTPDGYAICFFTQYV